MAGTILGRVTRVLDYIYDNPGSDLSLDALADVAAMSRFHWHRVWRGVMDETLADTVRRIRLHRAAAMLTTSKMPVAQVSRDVGYPNARSFARAFSDAYGMSPAAFRARGSYSATLRSPSNGETTMSYDIIIRDEPERRVAALRHVGPYLEVGRAFQKLSAIMAEHNLFARSRGMISVCYDDPSSVPAAEIRCDAGFIMAGSGDFPDPISAVIVPAGRHAVLLLKGPYTGIAAGFDALYSDWLPASGETPGDAPPFEIYLNTPMDTKPEDLRTEICLPLK